METFPAINPDYGLTRQPLFRTTVVPYGNKIEQRIRRDPAPRWRFELSWKLLGDTDKATLRAFFLARKGRGEAFLFADPDPTSATFGQVFTVYFEQDAANFEYFVYSLWRLNRVALIEA
jgi:hypothetical protein